METKADSTKTARWGVYFKSIETAVEINLKNNQVGFVLFVFATLLYCVCFFPAAKKNPTKKTNSSAQRSVNFVCDSFLTYTEDSSLLIFKPSGIHARLI